MGWRQARRAAGPLVLAAGALLTLLAVLRVLQTPVTYWSRTDAVFLVPTSSPTSTTRSLQLTQPGAIHLAGVVQRAVAGSAGPRLTGADATIVGQGLRSATWVRLVDRGGQWTSDFDRAVIDVQVVDRSPERVRERMSAALTAIAADLDRRQDAAGVRPDLRYSLTTSPSDPAVVAERGVPGQALAATAVLGVALTLGARASVGRRLRQGAGPGPAAR